MTLAGAVLQNNKLQEGVKEYKLFHQVGAPRMEWSTFLVKIPHWGPAGGAAFKKCLYSSLFGRNDFKESSSALKNWIFFPNRLKVSLFPPLGWQNFQTCHCNCSIPHSKCSIFNNSVPNQKMFNTLEIRQEKISLRLLFFFFFLIRIIKVSQKNQPQVC